jgi:hypothetical protein
MVMMKKIIHLIDKEFVAFWIQTCVVGIKIIWIKRGPKKEWKNETMIPSIIKMILTSLKGLKNMPIFGNNP